MRRTLAAAACVALFLALAAPTAFAADKLVARSASQSNLSRARSTPIPQFPADVKARGDKLQSTASPAVKAWVTQNAAAIAAGQGDAETFARAAAHSRWPNLRVGAGYDSLAFLLLYVSADDLVAIVKKDLDSTSELGETESLRLQMAMDRLSKLMTTLSNLLKKLSDTGDSIVRNLK